ncbi:MAG: hypothetical protein ACMXYK_03550 [Candidatus Woesearchaeota archaeon]
METRQRRVEDPPLLLMASSNLADIWDEYTILYKERYDSSRDDLYSEEIAKELQQKYSDITFDDWKKEMQRCIKSLNAKIDPSWNFDQLDSFNPPEYAHLRKVKNAFHLFHPKAKIWFACYGNLIRNTRVFKKGQKLRVYSIGHNWEQPRYGCYGFDRKNKKYVRYNVYHKLLHNFRFALVGKGDERGDVWVGMNPLWAFALSRGVDPKDCWPYEKYFKLT